jgi:hypothetical protein
MPWLGDVARIERAWLDAYHAADAEPCKPEDLARVDPAALGELRVRPHPATRLVQSDFPAVTIFTANRSDGKVETVESDRREDALVTRPHLGVDVRLLPPGGALFLKSLLEGKTLGEAAAAGAEDADLFDLAGNIHGMLEAGVFVEFVALRSENSKKDLQFADH